ncbi:7TM diverse intracellular signaling domain-containing protein [Pseudorhodoferax sp.]|uniref:sensor histidine kinase n=1 Tax=Pseudorhodoferax sp. TaxID=1993553 RepID=UPI0039E523E0
MSVKYYRRPFGWQALMLWFALCLGAAGPACGGELALAADQRFFGTAGQLEALDDPGGALAPGEAAAAGAWRPLPGNLGAGYIRSVVWLRVTLRVDAVQPSGWMLQLGNALLDDVRVYVAGPDGGWRLLGRSGEDLPRHLWPVDYRSPAFEFSPSAPGRYTLMLRLQSKNAMQTQLSVWQRLAFDNQSRREGLFFGLYFGFYLLLICLHAVFWVATRTRMSGLFLAYIGGTVLNEVVSLGLVQQATGMPVAWSDPLLGTSMCLTMPVAALVAFRQLELAAIYPRMARALLAALWAVALAGVANVLLGRYGAGVVPVQAVALAMIVLLTALDVFLLLRGYRPARFFALVFGVFYLGVATSFLRNLGWLPLNVWTEYASALGTMLHMVLLSLAIFGRYERRRRAREREQAHLAAHLAREHSQRLEQEVAARTAELLDEIGRREQLEEGLRATLELERRVRAEQRDFVAMVSHEFRTPLAIITTLAQQLGRNLGAPPERNLVRCANIQDAARRLLALVDEYLTDDRISEPRSLLRPQRCDLRALLDDLAREFAPGRMACRIGPGADAVTCDAGLLRIALRNLLANADRHAPADQPVQVHTRREGPWLHIDVVNAGEAIAPAERERLFQKYYRGAGVGNRPGAGLGLYLVQRIAQRLGGAVSLAAAGGAEPVCFSLRLAL